MNVHAAAVAVSNVAPSTVLDILVPSGSQEAGFSFKNNGANALTAFTVLGQFSKGAPFVTLASVAGDYSGPLWPLRRADALVTLGAGLTGKLFINVSGLYGLRVQAQLGVAASTMDVDGNVS